MKRRAVFHWNGVARASLALLAVTGAWFAFRPQSPRRAVPPTSPVQAFLLSPASGDEVAVGDYVPIALLGSAPGGLASAELFIDGQSMGEVTDSPESTSWVWQAWPGGVHSLSVKVKSHDGQLGESQTVLLNVLKTKDALQVAAGQGQMLAEIGERFGLLPYQIAEANARLDPLVPLLEGQPVNVPLNGIPQAQSEVLAAAADDIPLVILWELKITSLASRSYCYISDARGLWQRVPKPAFEYFESQDSRFAQIFEAVPAQGTTLQAECWGWIDGVLHFLGKGETELDAGQETPDITIDAQGVKFSGKLQYAPGFGQTAEPAMDVPAPHAVGVPKDAMDCMAHGGNETACNETLNSAASMTIVLEWEWVPGKEQGDQAWLNDITGYRLYEIDPITRDRTYMKRIEDAAIKAAVLPMPSGGQCLGVAAYAEGAQYGGRVESGISTFCLEQPPAVQHQTLTPVDWLTAGGDWINVDCPEALPHEPFGTGPAVDVGSYATFNEDGCKQEGSFSAGVEFALTSVPPDARVHRAVLTFSKARMEWEATGRALEPEPESCTRAIGSAKQHWIGAGAREHFSTMALSGPAFYTPYASIGMWTTPEVDVTPLVIQWLKHPETNHGFILTPVPAPEPLEGSGKCLSRLENLQLTIEYSTP